MKTLVETYNSPGLKKTGYSPITIYWKNARMIKNHSIIACAKEILNANINDEVVKINLIGPPSSGKSTLGKTLCHLIHDISMKETKVPYIVKIFGRDDLMDMEHTLASLQPLNHVLMFDDLSWLSAGNSKAKIDNLQKTFSEIRHLPGGKDVKIIIIFNFHYNFAMAKHLRQADFFIYTDIGSSELENMDKVVGAVNRKKCEEFIKVKQQIKSTSRSATGDQPEYKGNFSYALGKMNKFTYPNRAPFAPALFFNRDSVRHIVFPKREWIEPVCTACSGSITYSTQEVGDIQKFKEAALTAYNEYHIRTALRIMFLQKGINTWKPEVKRCMRWIERACKGKVFNDEEMMKAFNLENYEIFTTKKIPDNLGKDPEPQT